MMMLLTVTLTIPRDVDQIMTSTIMLTLITVMTSTMMVNDYENFDDTDGDEDNKNNNK